LEALVNARSDTKLLKIEVPRGAPVARQYGVRYLPTLWLYEDGALVAQDVEAVMARLR